MYDTYHACLDLPLADGHSIHLRRNVINAQPSYSALYQQQTHLTIDNAKANRLLTRLNLGPSGELRYVLRNLLASMAHAIEAQELIQSPIITRISLDKNNYAKGSRYCEIGGYAAHKRILTALAEATLITLTKGFKRQDGSGLLSFFRPTEKLTRWLGKQTSPIVSNTTETILLKGENGRLIEYEDTLFTNVRRELIDNYHCLMGEHSFTSTLRGDLHPFMRNLRCVFNNDWSCGGRFYYTLQNLPKAERATWLLDGQPCLDLDLVSLHIAILYVLEGLLPPADPYSFKGLTREQAKLASVVSLNASTELGAARACFSKLNSEGERIFPTFEIARNAITAMRETHEAIANHLCSGVGLRLQRIDSDICAGVMSRSIAADLPIALFHDGWIFGVAHQNRFITLLQETLAELGLEQLTYKVKPLGG